MTHYYHVRKWMPDRFRQPCRVVARGRMGAVLIEFADGWRAVVSRWAVRRLDPASGG